MKTQRQQVGGEGDQNTSTNNANYSKIYLTRGRITFSMLICVSSWWYLLSSQLFREWKIGCSTKVSVIFCL